MGNALLVARREYLAYITAWGFWVGIIFTPLALLLALGLPALIESSQPARYYAVLEDGNTFSDALTEYEAERRSAMLWRCLKLSWFLSRILQADASAGEI